MSFRRRFKSSDKNQSNNIHNICHFEENMDKLFQERNNFDASFATVLEFSQLVYFAQGIPESSDKWKSTTIQAIFQGALSMLLLLLHNT